MSNYLNDLGVGRVAEVGVWERMGMTSTNSNANTPIVNVSMAARSGTKPYAAHEVTNARERLELELDKFMASVTAMHAPGSVIQTIMATKTKPLAAGSDIHT